MTKNNRLQTPLRCAFLLMSGVMALQSADAQVIDLRPKNPFPTRGVGRIQRGTIRVPQAMPGRDFAAEMGNEFIEFKSVQNSIDAENLGGAGFVGAFESATDKSARIEFRSTVGIRLKYEDGADLKNQNGTETLPTQWQTAVLGTGVVNGQNFNAPSQYSNFENTPDGRNGVGTTIDWAASPADFVKGVQARVSVTRNGLRDRAGSYKTELTLSWYKF